MFSSVNTINSKDFLFKNARQLTAIMTTPYDNMLSYGTVLDRYGQIINRLLSIILNIFTINQFKNLKVKLVQIGKFLNKTIILCLVQHTH